MCSAIVFSLDNNLQFTTHRLNTIALISIKQIPNQIHLYFQSIFLVTWRVNNVRLIHKWNIGGYSMSSNMVDSNSTISGVISYLLCLVIK